ncbi:MAG: phosphotransferase [Anaerolineales bacterium]
MQKPYHELTRLGKIRRLHKIALKALEEYDLSIAWVKFLTIETNTMFQVRSTAGERFVHRIYSDEETTLRENQAEMLWLTALARDTDLEVSEPIPRTDGKYITIINEPGVSKDRRCVLFKWVPGRPLENYLNPENYYKLGQILAKLHDHASTLTPLPQHILPKKWDKVFYYPDEPVIYNSPDYSHFFPPVRIKVMEEVIKQADDLFARLFADQDGLILIHGDLHYWNVHYYRGDLYVIDFEDINLGYPVQDIAVTLYYGRRQGGYEEWKAAFRQGYSSVRAWPVESERTIDTLIAARSVNFINYVARIDPSPQEYIIQRSEELVQFLNKYS